MKKPERVSYDEFTKTISMFWRDNNWEESIKKEVDAYADSLSEKLKGIDSKKGLLEYIRNDKQSLTNILALLEIPEEKFKRIISLLRREQKYVFTSEWSLEKTRSMIIDDSVGTFRDEVCDLLLNGSESEKFKRKIPDFYRESFKIDSTTMEKLNDKEELRKLAKKQLENKYVSGVTASVLKKVEEYVKLTCDLEGLTYEKNKPVEGFDREFTFIIPNSKTPQILITCSYNITTSSTQSRFRDSVIRARDIIKKEALGITTVNIIEGAGWIGRQSDLKTIYENSDYVLNISNIGRLDAIIKYGMEAKV